MSERAVLFGNPRSMVGILSDPGVFRCASGTAVVFINAGLVHRVGPNRVYVQMARSLAGMGVPSLRFDLTGIGDSDSRTGEDLAGGEAAVWEVQEAMSMLREEMGISRFILVGICSGAAIAFDTAVCDSRIVGAILINAPALGAVTAALRIYLDSKKNPRYYLRTALFDPGC